MPAGWFTEPVRAWASMRFVSELFTPGRPLCILTPAQINTEKRAEALLLLGKRPYRFRRLAGRVGGAELIWAHLQKTGGVLSEESAAEMVGGDFAHLRKMVGSALDARVLVLRNGYFELGPVVPQWG